MTGVLQLGPSDLLQTEYRTSLCRLWASTSINLAYGFMLADQGMLLAPLESVHLFGHRAELGLAALLVSGGISQLAGPAAGRWSDRHRSNWGRRRPCLVKGSAAALVLTGFLTVFSFLQCKYFFVMTFLLQQIAWNVIITVQAGLVPDIVIESQRGIAGGLTAANTLVGALMALLSVRFLPGYGSLVHYAIISVITVLCTALVCSFSRERPSNDEVEEVDNRSLYRQFKSCYELDLYAYPQFTKLLASKTLYTAAVMVKGFLLYFIQDTFKLNDAELEKAIVADTSVAAEASAAVSAVLVMSFLGQASSRIIDTKKMRREDCEYGSSPIAVSVSVAPSIDTNFVTSLRPRLSAIAGAAWMAVLWAGPMYVGYGVMTDFAEWQRSNLGAAEDTIRSDLKEQWAHWMILGTGVWGVGQGLYLAGDQALSFALLPNQEEASRFLGMTSVCTAFGAVFGAGAVGMLIYIFGSIGQDETASSSAKMTGPGYGYPGYAAMFVFAMTLSGLAYLVLLNLHRNCGDCKRKHSFHRELSTPFA